MVQTVLTSIKSFIFCNFDKMNSWFKNKITTEEIEVKNLEHYSKGTKIRVIEASWFYYNILFYGGHRGLVGLFVMYKSHGAKGWWFETRSRHLFFQFSQEADSFAVLAGVRKATYGESRQDAWGRGVGASNKAGAVRKGGSGDKRFLKVERSIHLFI